MLTNGSGHLPFKRGRCNMCLAMLAMLHTFQTLLGRYRPTVVLISCVDQLGSCLGEEPHHERKQQPSWIHLLSTVIIQSIVRRLAGTLPRVAQVWSTPPSQSIGASERLAQETFLGCTNSNLCRKQAAQPVANSDMANMPKQRKGANDCLPYYHPIKKEVGLYFVNLLKQLSLCLVKQLH